MERVSVKGVTKRSKSQFMDQWRQTGTLNAQVEEAFINRSRTLVIHGEAVSYHHDSFIGRNNLDGGLERRRMRRPGNARLAVSTRHCPQRPGRCAKVLSKSQIT